MLYRVFGFYVIHYATPVSGQEAKAWKGCQHSPAAREKTLGQDQ